MSCFSLDANRLCLGWSDICRVGRLLPARWHTMFGPAALDQSKWVSSTWPILYQEYLDKQTDTLSSHDFIPLFSRLLGDYIGRLPVMSIGLIISALSYLLIGPIPLLQVSPAWPLMLACRPVPVLSPCCQAWPVLACNIA